MQKYVYLYSKYLLIGRDASNKVQIAKTQSIYSKTLSVFMLCTCVLCKSAIAAPNVESSTATVQRTVATTSGYGLSTPTKFDLLLDEHITKHDPRIKSIIYSGLHNHGTVLISYINPNAADLANRLAMIFTHAHVKVAKPQQVQPPVAGQHGMDKYVIVCIRFGHVG